MYSVKSSHDGRMLAAGERLKAERLRVGLSQHELAAHAGVHRQTQVNYERGPKPPPDHYLESVAGLGIDVEFVLTGYRQTDGQQVHQAKNALLVMLLGALGYQDADPAIREAVSIWNDSKPSPGIEGLAGRLVGESPTLQYLKKSAADINAESLTHALHAFDQVSAAHPQPLPLATRVNILAELYRAALEDGKISARVLSTLIALRD